MFYTRSDEELPSLKTMYSETTGMALKARFVIRAFLALGQEKLKFRVMEKFISALII